MPWSRRGCPPAGRSTSVVAKVGTRSGWRSEAGRSPAWTSRRPRSSGRPRPPPRRASRTDASGGSPGISRSTSRSGTYRSPKRGPATRPDQTDSARSWTTSSSSCGAAPTSPAPVALSQGPRAGPSRPGPAEVEEPQLHDLQPRPCATAAPRPAARSRRSRRRGQDDACHQPHDCLDRLPRWCTTCRQLQPRFTPRSTLCGMPIPSRANTFTCQRHRHASVKGNV
jgi:hypothetical protein